MTFQGKTLFISGASRGIGLAIACRLARDGANIILAAKTAEPHPKLPGTIFSAAAEVEAAGGKALPVVCDIRDEQQVRAAVEQGVAAFGGIDVCVNNASAISLTGTLSTDMKRYDLMNQVNARGTFLCSKLALPHLLRGRESAHPQPGAAARHGRQVVRAARRLHDGQVRHEPVHARHGRRVQGPGRRQLALAADRDRHRRRPLRPRRRAMAAQSRNAAIMADAAYAILARPARTCTGNFFIDEEVLRDEGIDRLLGAMRRAPTTSRCRPTSSSPTR